MKREIKKYLFDIKTSIDSINDYLGENRNFFEFQKNKLLRRGIEREIEIIGEATNRILKLDSPWAFVRFGASNIIYLKTDFLHLYMPLVCNEGIMGLRL